MYIVNVTLSRFIVLYTYYRVNRGTNLFVILYYVICLLLPLCVLWKRVWVVLDVAILKRRGVLTRWQLVLAS